VPPGARIDMSIYEKQENKTRLEPNFIKCLSKCPYCDQTIRVKIRRKKNRVYVVMIARNE